MFLQILAYTRSKSLYISWAVSNFYRTEIEILAGFKSVGNTEKKVGANYEQLLRVFFSCFHGQKKDLIFLKKYFSIRTEKLHQKWKLFIGGKYLRKYGSLSPF